MSYDLEARADKNYSRSITRAQVVEAVAENPDVHENGTHGFVLLRGGWEEPELWMEIDLEQFDEEDEPRGEAADSPEEFNSISFHLPYGFIDALDECLEVALHIASAVGFVLEDHQSGEVVNPEDFAAPVPLPEGLASAGAQYGGFNKRPIRINPRPRRRKRPWWRFW